MSDRLSSLIIDNSEDLNVQVGAVSIGKKHECSHCIYVYMLHNITYYTSKKIK